MNRVVAKIMLILLGVFLCFGAQVSLRVFHIFNYKDFSLSRTAGMTESDIAIWRRLKEAFKEHDSRTVNEMLQVNPGEIQLVVTVCPIYPEGFGPVARIFLKNVSKRRLIILKPVIDRLSSPSYKSYNSLGRLCDIFSVEWGIDYFANECHSLEPNQVLALPITDLAVEGIGLHEVNFTLATPVYESISENEIKSRSLKVSEATAAFKIEGGSIRSEPPSQNQSTVNASVPNNK